MEIGRSSKSRTDFLTRIYLCIIKKHEAMKKIITAAFLVIASIAASAQSIVRGTVHDSLTNEAECFATIQFFNSSNMSTPIAYTVTDAQGSFSQNLSNGQYTLLFSNIGRQDKSVDFAVEGEPVDLGDILVSDDALTLNSSMVVAQKELVKLEVDKVSYKVEDDAEAQGSTVLDMLRKVPMVTVDGSDNITVNGSSNFQVYVDGKPNQMLTSNPSQAFKAMPASMVKNIEVVTNPGAKYDAEGVGGVLNITTTSAVGSQAVADGVYGTVGAMASTRGGSTNAYVSLQKGKFSMGLNASVMKMGFKDTENNMERVQDTEAGELITTSDTDVNKLGFTNVMGSLNMGYEIDDNNLISATASIMNTNAKTDMTTITEMSLAGLELSSYTTGTNQKNGMNSISASIDYQHLWKNNKSRNIIVSYQFSASPTKTVSTSLLSGSSMTGLDLSNRKSDNFANSFSHTLQSDFTTPLGQNQTLSAGVKAILRHNLSNDYSYLFDGTDYVLGSQMDYDFYNRIGGAYVEYTGQFGIFGLKAGARYEHTWQSVTYGEGQGNDFSVNYGNFVPSASMQFTLSNRQNIGLSYNMRISRPGISYLNPFVDTTDPTALTYGNSELDAERGHNISLVYNYMSQKFMTSLTLRESYTANGISSYSFYDSDNLLNTTYGNVVKSSVTGLNGYIMYMPFLSTRIIFNGGVDYTDLRSEVLGQSNSGWGYNAMLNVQQTIPGEVQLGVSLISVGKRISLQGYSTGMNMANISVSRKFLDNKLNVSLSSTIGIEKGFKITNKTYTAGSDFRSINISSQPLGMANLSISWSFGKQTRVKTVNTRKESDVINLQGQAESMSSMVGM